MMTVKSIWLWYQREGDRPSLKAKKQPNPTVREVLKNVSPSAKTKKKVVMEQELKKGIDNLHSHSYLTITAGSYSDTDRHMSKRKR